MIKHINRLTLLAGLLLAFQPGIAAADGHWLFGGAIGAASIDEDVDGFRFDSNSTSFRLYGGYEFNDYFALEAGYMDLGSFDEQVDQGGNIVPVSADADGFTFAARGSMPIGEKFSLHGTIGSFFWDGASEIAGVGDNASDANMFFGAGAGFDLTSNFSLRADVSQYELDGVDSNVFSLGFQLSFQ